jgi:hypothetical protein
MPCFSELVAPLLNQPINRAVVHNMLTGTEFIGLNVFSKLIPVREVTVM